jgi:hypothetical protein
MTTAPTHPPLERMVMVPRICFVPGCGSTDTFEYTTMFDHLLGLLVCPMHANCVYNGTSVQQHVRNAHALHLPCAAISGIPHQSNVLRSDKRLQSDWTLVPTGEYRLQPAPFKCVDGVVYIVLYRAVENVVKSVMLRDYLALNPTIRLSYCPEQDAHLSAPYVEAWQQALRILISE